MPFYVILILKICRSIR